jgi:NADPH dehydrogenase (quinone)
MQLAKAFFVERGHQVAETSVERGYNPEEEVEKHVAAHLVILQTPVNWFSAPWIYRNTWARSSMSAWPKKSCSRAMTAREKTPAGSMAWAEKCRERSSWSPRPGMLREKPSITPTGYYSAARNDRPVPPHHFQLQIHRYDILLDFGVFDIFKNPDIPLALEDYKRHLEKHCLLASRIANIA